MPPYVVFLAVGYGGTSGVTGGGGGPQFNVSWTVVDSDNNSVPYATGALAWQLLAADTESSVQASLETYLTTLLTNWPLDTTGITFVWLS
jgi:hypothetical protein